MADFAGVDFTKVRSPRISNVKYATKGFAFAHATEGGNLGLREPVSLKVSPAPKVEDAAGREILHAYECELTGKMLQTRLDVELQNIYKLSKGLHQLQLLTANGDAISFVENGGTIASPTGSKLVGCTWKFMIGLDARDIEATWRTRIPGPELQWIIDNLGSASTGGVSGTSLGLAAQTYTRSGFRRANFAQGSVSPITVAGFSVGDVKDIKFEVSADGRETIWKQKYCNMLDLSLEFEISQTSAVELSAALEKAEADSAIVLNTAAGEAITLAGGCASIMPEPMFGDSNDTNGIKFSCKGKIPMETAGVTFTSATAITFNLLGY